MIFFNNFFFRKEIENNMMNSMFFYIYLECEDILWARLFLCGRYVKIHVINKQNIK